MNEIAKRVDRALDLAERWVRVLELRQTVTVTGGVEPVAAPAPEPEPVAAPAPEPEPVAAPAPAVSPYPDVTLMSCAEIQAELDRLAPLTGIERQKGQKLPTLQRMLRDARGLAERRHAAGMLPLPVASAESAQDAPPPPSRSDVQRAMERAVVHILRPLKAADVPPIELAAEAQRFGAGILARYSAACISELDIAHYPAVIADCEEVVNGDA